MELVSNGATGFFREPDLFRILRDECKRWIARGANGVRVWCAASATGEEPYTLAMTLAESLDEHGVDWKLLASDVSVAALHTAAQGIYDPSRLERVPPLLRQRYFEAEYCDEAGQRTRRVASELRARITFERQRSSAPPPSLRGEFDAVFCRNVLSQFVAPARQQLVGEIERLLRPGGVWIVGGSETLHGTRSNLNAVRPSVYRKPEPA
jgi:chemotaxis protein methyltransferase CheR